MTANISLGLGYSTFTGGPANKVLDVEVSEKQGGGLKVNTHICTSTQEILSALDIGGSIGVQTEYGGGEAKSTFARKITTTFKSVTILVVASRVTGGISVTSARFKDGAEFKNAAELYATGGDRYVSYIQTGAGYAAAYTFRAESSEKQEAITASAKANAHFLSANVDGSFNTAIKNITSDYSTSYEFSQDCWGFSEAQLPSEAEVGQWANGFGKITLDAPTVLKFGTESYTRVPGHPDMKQILTYYDMYTRSEPGRPAISAIERQLGLTLKSLQLVRKVYGFYGKTGLLKDARFSELQSKLATASSLLQDWKHAVDQNPTEPSFTLKMDLDLLQYPTVNFKLVESEVKVGDSIPSADPFHDITSDMILRLVYPKKIFIRNSRPVINLLSTTYKFYDDESSGEMLCEHGSQVGDIVDRFELGRDDKLGATVGGNRVTLDGLSIFAPSLPVGFILLTNPDGTDRGFGVSAAGGRRETKDSKEYSFVGFSGSSTSKILNTVGFTWCKFGEPVWNAPVWE